MVICLDQSSPMEEEQAGKYSHKLPTGNTRVQGRTVQLWESEDTMLTQKVLTQKVRVESWLHKRHIQYLGQVSC